jgi:hypothetical protein
MTAPIGRTTDLTHTMPTCRCGHWMADHVDGAGLCQEATLRCQCQQYDEVCPVIDCKHLKADHNGLNGQCTKVKQATKSVCACAHYIVIAEPEPAPEPTPGVNEVQRLSFPDPPDGGTFIVAFKDTWSNPVPYHPSITQLRLGLEGISTVGEGNVRVDQPDTWDYAITFQGALGEQDVEPLEVDGTNLLNGTVEVGTVTEGSPPVTPEPTPGTHLPGT